VAVTGKYTDPLQVSETPEVRARINAIADRDGVSQAQVIRDIIGYGLRWRENKSAQKKEKNRG
jgi:hypothetical protein